MHIDLTEENFDATITQEPTPMLVDFWAPWCGPCKVMSPIIEQIAAETPGLRVGKVNVDEHGSLAQRYNVLSIPTFILFKGGSVVEQFAGSMPKEVLMSRIRQHI